MKEIQLEQCVCGHIVTEYMHYSRRGNDGIIVHDYSIRCLNPKANWCPCETPRYNTIDEAATAWNKMQRALKSGWTSEVPTVAGLYMYFGDIYTLTGSVWFKLEKEKMVIFDGKSFFLPTCGRSPRMQKVADRKMFKGFWHRIHYPDPPKD